MLGISRAWAWVFLFGLIIFFSVSIFVTQDINFLNLRNTQLILSTIVSVLLMGLGQTFVIISGGIDLSVGWVMGLASVVSAKTTVVLMGDSVGEVPGDHLGLRGGALRGLGVRAHQRRSSSPSCGSRPSSSPWAWPSSRAVPRSSSRAATRSAACRTGMRDFGNESLLYWSHGEGGGTGCPLPAECG